MEMGSAVPDQFQMIGTRSRANLIYDFVCKVVMSRFGDDPDVKFMNERGFLVMVVKEQFALRFKKLDQNKRTCKGHTAGYKAYFSHQLTLPGMPAEAIRLVLGYQLDAAEAAISDLLLTFQWERNVLWFESIKDVVVEIERKDEPAAASNDGNPSETHRKPRVKATIIPKIADAQRAREQQGKHDARDGSGENAT